MKVLRVGNLVADSLYSAGNMIANNSCVQRQSETIECFNDPFNKTLDEVVWYRTSYMRKLSVY